MIRHVPHTLWPLTWLFIVGLLWRHMGSEICRAWWRHQMEHFPRHWPFLRGIHRSPVNSPHTGQWRGALMFLWSWINGSVNNREVGNLRRHHAHYDVIVINVVEYRGRNKLVTILPTALRNAFSWLKLLSFDSNRRNLAHWNSTRLTDECIVDRYIDAPTGKLTVGRVNGQTDRWAARPKISTIQKKLRWINYTDIFISIVFQCSNGHIVLLLTQTHG